MFSKDFYPTPNHIIEWMIGGLDLSQKVILEPSAGKGDIVDYCLANGAKEVLACELHPDLRQIVAGKCKVIGDDFLKVTSDQISHVNMIVMNPPFSADEKHILHAFNIAPAGCAIYALCNSGTIRNPYNQYRRQLNAIIQSNGGSQSLGNCFADGERYTEVEVDLIKLQKAGGGYEAEFEGFFMEEDREEQENGIISYNFIRDLVNRYVAAVKIYDEQLETANRLNDLTSNYFFIKQPDLAISVTRLSVPLKRNEFKKEMQKAGWQYIFQRMNMEKYATKGLKDDINKFVEQQEHIPFTMKNIYRMLEIVVGTHSGRMDQALQEVFDKVTKHTHENRYNLEGWKTNSHYLLNQKFIMGWIVSRSYSGGMEIRYGSTDADLVADMNKALCYLTGTNYDDILPLDRAVQYRYKLKDKRTGKYLMEDRGTYKIHCISNKLDDWSFQKDIKAFTDRGIDVEIEDRKPQWGEWFEWGFFMVKGYKKGTMHFKFKDLDVWAKFNQNIARIKGYPLFEGKMEKRDVA